MINVNFECLEFKLELISLVNFFSIQNNFIIDLIFYATSEINFDSIANTPSFYALSYLCIQL